jgi:hypothetical protein
MAQCEHPDLDARGCALAAADAALEVDRALGRLEELELRIGQRWQRDIHLGGLRVIV